MEASRSKSGIENRKMIHVAVKAGEQSVLRHGENTIRVMQFNILAKMYAKPEPCGFPLVSKRSLEWDRRLVMLKDELIRHHADVLSLEEGIKIWVVLGNGLSPCAIVDEPELFGAFLFEHGYNVEFFRGAKRDATGGIGIMTAWKTASLEIMSTVRLEFEDGTGQVGMIHHFKSRKWVSIKKDLIVATTHLKAKVGFEDTRFSQGSALTSTVDALIRSKKLGTPPVIISGDFNDVPDSKVCFIYHLYARGIDSAYTYYPGTDGVEPWSTFKTRTTSGKPKKTLRTIDYVWYTTSNLEVSRLLSIPDIEEPGLPCETYPSDHLALVVDFKVETEARIFQ